MLFVWSLLGAALAQDSASFEQMEPIQPTQFIAGELTPKQKLRVDRFIHSAVREPASASLVERFRYAQARAAGAEEIAALRLGLQGDVYSPYLQSVEMFTLGQALNTAQPDDLMRFAESDMFPQLPDYTQERVLSWTLETARRGGLTLEEIDRLVELKPTILDEHLQQWAAGLGLSPEQTRGLLQLFKDAMIARGVAGGPTPLTSPGAGAPDISGGATLSAYSIESCALLKPALRPEGCPQISPDEPHQQYLDSIEYKVVRLEPEQALWYLRSVVDEQLPQHLLSDDYGCWSDGEDALLPEITAASISKVPDVPPELAVELRFVCNALKPRPEDGAGSVRVGQMVVVFHYLDSNRATMDSICRVSAHSTKVFVPSFLKRLALEGITGELLVKVAADWQPEPQTALTSQENRFCESVREWTNNAIRTMPAP